MAKGKRVDKIEELYQDTAVGYKGDFDKDERGRQISYGET